MIRMCWDNDRNTRLSASECYAMLSTAYAQVHTRPTQRAISLSFLSTL